MSRDTTRYLVYLDDVQIDRGVTSDLARRTAEIRERWPTADLRPVGRVTTRRAALRWLAARSSARCPAVLIDVGGVCRCDRSRHDDDEHRHSAGDESWTWWAPAEETQWTDRLRARAVGPSRPT